MFSSPTLYYRNGAPSVYRANAVTLDNATVGDLTISNSGGSALANSATGVCALRFRVDGGAGTERAWFDRYGMSWYLNSSNHLVVSFLDYPFTKVKSYDFGVVSVGATWHDIIFSWDTSNNTFYGLLDGATTASQTANTGNFDAGWSGSTDLYFGSANHVLYPMYCSVAEQFLSTTAACIDITQPTTLAKWRDAGTGKPVSLGSDGSLLTGSQPEFYLNGTAATIATNKGSHGNLTKEGTITDASTSPSD